MRLNEICTCHAQQSEPQSTESCRRQKHQCFCWNVVREDSCSQAFHCWRFTLFNSWNFVFFANFSASQLWGEMVLSKNLFTGSKKQFNGCVFDLTDTPLCSHMRKGHTLLSLLHLDWTLDKMCFTADFTGKLPTKHWMSHPRPHMNAENSHEFPFDSWTVGCDALNGHLFDVELVHNQQWIANFAPLSCDFQGWSGSSFQPHTNLPHVTDCKSNLVFA